MLFTLRKYEIISGRKLICKNYFSESFGRRTKKEAGLKIYKVQKVSEKNFVKNETVKERVKLLKPKFFDKFIYFTMEDKTYATEDFFQIPGKEYHKGI